ncbi:MAG: N-acetyltransferase [Planctomycetota bacterium]
MDEKIVVRKEKARDIEAVREVNLRAFGQTQEADIVDALRRNCPDLLSLVAVRNKCIVGHILFSPVTVEGGYGVVQGMGLAPMAVLPEHQRQGIGSALVRKGIARLEKKGCPFVVVLGHAEYYPRFGFKRASLHGIRCEWEVPDEVFRILPLQPSRLQGVSGPARYRPEFGEA